MKKVSKVAVKNLNTLYERYGFDFNLEDRMGSLEELEVFLAAQEDMINTEHSLSKEMSVILLKSIMTKLTKELV